MEELFVRIPLKSFMRLGRWKDPIIDWDVLSAAQKDEIFCRMVPPWVVSIFRPWEYGLMVDDLELVVEETEHAYSCWSWSCFLCHGLGLLCYQPCKRSKLHRAMLAYFEGKNTKTSNILEILEKRGVQIRIIEKEQIPLFDKSVHSVDSYGLALEFQWEPVTVSKQRLLADTFPYYRDFRRRLSVSRRSSSVWGPEITPAEDKNLLSQLRKMNTNAHMIVDVDEIDLGLDDDDTVVPVEEEDDDETYVGVSGRGQSEEGKKFGERHVLPKSYVIVSHASVGTNLDEHHQHADGRGSHEEKKTIRDDDEDEEEDDDEDDDEEDEEEDGDKGEDKDVEKKDDEVDEDKHKDKGADDDVDDDDEEIISPAQSDEGW
eukprot:TRINITY_DN1169_c1_g6_i1.p1 TRINITY_DN1169_c1_g6~~TRINITY_DN1169_c1_g6_i1.p1  ORF type:complete len:392 (+),score=131.54 TRINITY_DN1169_c1_g6_i1:59-1177(+)